MSQMSPGSMGCRASNQAGVLPSRLAFVSPGRVASGATRARNTALRLRIGTLTGSSSRPATSCCRRWIAGTQALGKARLQSSTGSGSGSVGTKMMGWISGVALGMGESFHPVQGSGEGAVERDSDGAAGRVGVLCRLAEDQAEAGQHARRGRILAESVPGPALDPFRVDEVDTGLDPAAQQAA